MHARRTPARERLPLPRLLLRARPRRAAGARPPARARSAGTGRTSSRSATATTSTCRVADLAEHGVEADRILLLTNLRVLGYVFNPVSFFYCYRGRRARVHRGRGEQHLRRAAAVPALAENRHRRSRPTSTTSGCTSRRSSRWTRRYRWLFTEPGDELSVRIDVSRGRRRPFWATLHGRRQRADQRVARPGARPLPADAAARDRPHPLQAAAALAEAGAVHPQAAVRARARGRCAVSDGRCATLPSRRREPRAAAPAERLVARARSSARSTGRDDRAAAAGRRGARFGAGPPVRSRSRAATSFRRLAPRGRVGLGESYVAGDWRADDLVGCFEILIRAVDALAARTRGSRGSSAAARTSRRARACAAPGATSTTTTTSATTSTALPRRVDDVLVRDLGRRRHARRGPGPSSGASARSSARPGRPRARDRLRLGRVRAARPPASAARA